MTFGSVIYAEVMLIKMHSILPINKFRILSGSQKFPVIMRFVMHIVLFYLILLIASPQANAAARWKPADGSSN